jgi:hypothetical protein
MRSWWFNTAVILLWLATMSWLVREKVLPPLLVGEPPNYSRIIESQEHTAPTAWHILVNHRRVGWALSETQRQPSGLVEIRDRVHFDVLPVEEVTATWARTFSKWLAQPIGKLRMDARSILTIDPLGRLLGFDSAVQLHPLNEVLRVRGTVEGQQLQLTIDAGGTPFTSEAFLPSDALLSDALSPQSRLPGLRVGQTWTVPVYSPLWPVKSPLEVIHAEVESMEPLFWNGVMEDCWLVVYRSDSESGADRNQPPRGRLWVRRNGTVLRQQVAFFNVMITFDRLPDSGAVEMAKAEGPLWWMMDYWQRGKKHDRVR